MANRSPYEVTVQLILAVVVVIILMCIRMVVGLMPSSKSGRGWFWELLLWLLIVELPQVDQQLLPPHP